MASFEFTHTAAAQLSGSRTVIDVTH